MNVVYAASGGLDDSLAWALPVFSIETILGIVPVELFVHQVQGESRL